MQVRCTPAAHPSPHWMDAAETETVSDAQGTMIVSGMASGIGIGIMVTATEIGKEITTAGKAATGKVPTGITAIAPGHVTGSTAPPGADSL